MNLRTVPLKSASIARVLLWFLRIALALEGFSTIFRLMAIALPTTSPTYATWQYLLGVPSLLLALAILLLSLVWIYRLHDELRQCYPNYPIGAWDALYRFILPGYNIWGIWNTLMTMARHFKAEESRLHHDGLLLRRLVFGMYGIAIASSLLRRVIYRHDSIGRVSIRNLPDSLLSVAIAGNQLLGLVGNIVLLAIAQTIVNAVQLKFRQIRRIS